MFENRQDQVQQLLSESLEFRRIYNKHQDLHEKVEAAENGVIAMEDSQLHQMKKEKLWAKDKLADMLNTSH